MSKTRVYELAKTLEISNKELLEKLKEMGIEAKSHSSGLEQESVDKVLAAFGKRLKNLKRKRLNLKRMINFKISRKKDLQIIRIIEMM